MCKLEEKILKVDELIRYNWKTKEYGRAEFIFCPIWKRGKIIKLHIYPMQQPDAKYFYILDVTANSKYICPYSWTHLGKENPWPWQFYWCKEHKCMSIKIYVPPNTNTLRITTGTSLNIIFEET